MAKCSIGGQAVMEGVMMRGKTAAALAVLDSEGNVRLWTKRIKPKQGWWRKTPFVRGFFNLIDAMIDGIKYLLMSAEISLEDEDEKLTAKQTTTLMTTSVVLGLALFVGMFMLLPNFLTSLLLRIIGFDPADIIKNLIEGGFRLTLFVAYLLAVSLIKDIRRVFMFHGAEHRTINCYEKELPLTIENIQTCSTVHDRCGTSFMFFVMVVSILIFSLTGWGNIFVRVALRILMLPVISGVSYEMLKLLNRYNIFIFMPFKWLGKLLQLITTKKPEDKMVVAALAAFNAVIEMDNDQSIAEQDFEKEMSVKDFLQKLSQSCDCKTVQPSDIDWIVCEVLGIKRAQMQTPMQILPRQQYKAKKLLAELKQGKPLQYILGYTEFYGLKFFLNQNVLIPRMETELLAEQAIKALQHMDNPKVLDLCCGSGCIGISIAKNTNAEVTLADKSQETLDVAKRNCEENKVEAKYIKGDMFDKILDKFDVLVINPPYIPTADIAGLDKNVRDFEPHSALDGGVDGLDFYKIIAAKAHRVLERKGLLLLEVGINQATAVKNLLQSNFENIQILKDYSGIERIVTATAKI